MSSIDVAMTFETQTKIIINKLMEMDSLLQSYPE